MKFMGFSDWAKFREEQNPQQVPASGKPSATNAEIKQVIASNLTKPKQARSAALMALAKKKQGDPKTTPRDLQDIANAISDDGSAGSAK